MLELSAGGREARQAAQCERSRRVLVTGATGNVGRGVMDRLVTAGVPVRAAVTPQQLPQSESRTAAPAGVAEVGFDFTDGSTWSAAFDGVEQMFLMRPPHLSRPRSQMAPALEAARAAGVRQVVLLSLQGAERNRVVPHAALEAWLRDSGLSWTFVRPSFFMQNLSTTHRSDIQDRDEIIVPAGGGATSFVDAEDVAAVAAAALLHPEQHHHRACTPTGPEALTYEEVADILTDVLGRRIDYSRPGLLRYARHARASLGMPWAMVAVTSGIYSVARLGRAAGVTDDVLDVLRRPPTDFMTFARRSAASWSRTPAA